MSVVSGSSPKAAQWSAARMALHAMVFAALWGVLAGGKGWFAGIPVVLLAAGLSCLLLPRAPLSIVGLVRFLPFFAWNSLRGGIDVAWRALHPRLPIKPAVLRYEMQLDAEIPRVVVANVVTLLPGTLSADLRGHVLLVHVLNARGPFPAAITQVERRVADLFGLPRVGTP